MKSRLMFCSVAVLWILASWGCAKNPPQTPASLDLGAETQPEPAAPVPSLPTAAPVATATGPDFMTADLDELNRYVRAEGLLGAVYFDFDRADLRAEARDQLVRNARFLQQHRELVVTIEGHCDERGTAEYNLALGENRAATTSDYVVSLGVDRSGLRSLSLGEERPQCVESEERCWWQNRRADFVITGRRARG